MERDPEKTARSMERETFAGCVACKSIGQTGEHGHSTRDFTPPCGNDSVDDGLGCVSEHDIRLFASAKGDEGLKCSKIFQWVVPCRLHRDRVVSDPKRLES